MYALINNSLYWYQRFRGKNIIIARNGQPVDDSFVSSGEGIFKKEVDTNSSDISDIYNVHFYVMYKDEAYPEQDTWAIGDGVSSDRPYRIEDGEVCISGFGAVSGNGWTTNGRDESSKIIRLSDCSKFWVEYKYTKKDGVMCSPEQVDKQEVSKEELVRKIVEHRV